MIDTTGKTFQEVSDELAEVLIKQGKRCMNNMGKCCYADGKGNHCAIGHLIDKSYYHSPGGVHNLVHAAKNRESTLGINHKFIEDNMSILGLYQSLHDHSTKYVRANIIKKIKRKGINMDAWIPWIELGTISLKLR